jgi:hypothetical protein
VGKPERKISFERPTHRWVDNIKMHLREIGWDAWTELIWLRIGTSFCEHSNEPSGSTKCWEILE